MPVNCVPNGTFFRSSAPVLLLNELDCYSYSAHKKEKRISRLNVNLTNNVSEFIA
jgi:hypothetical protein